MRRGRTRKNRRGRSEGKAVEVCLAEDKEGDKGEEQDLSVGGGYKRVG